MKVTSKINLIGFFIAIGTLQIIHPMTNQLSNLHLNAKAIASAIGYVKKEAAILVPIVEDIAHLVAHNDFNGLVAYLNEHKDKLHLESSFDSLHKTIAGLQEAMKIVDQKAATFSSQHPEFAKPINTAIGTFHSKVIPQLEEFQNKFVKLEHTLTTVSLDDVINTIHKIQSSQAFQQLEHAISPEIISFYEQEIKPFHTVLKGVNTKAIENSIKEILNKIVTPGAPFNLMNIMPGVKQIHDVVPALMGLIKGTILLISHIGSILSEHEDILPAPVVKALNEIHGHSDQIKSVSENITAKVTEHVETAIETTPTGGGIGIAKKPYLPTGIYSPPLRKKRRVGRRLRMRQQQFKAPRFGSQQQQFQTPIEPTSLPDTL